MPAVPMQGEAAEVGENVTPAGSGVGGGVGVEVSVIVVRWTCAKPVAAAKERVTELSELTSLGAVHVMVAAAPPAFL